jgi:hypothetical protein
MCSPVSAADALERQIELALGSHQIPEMLDRPHTVELRDTGARRRNHRFTGRVRHQVHMKITQAANQVRRMYELWIR